MVTAIIDHERLLDQRGQQVEHVFGVDPGVRRLAATQVPAAV
jgi:hypothetical protein